MKYLILILFFISCKKKEYTSANCPSPRVYYYYFNYNLNTKCCGKYISPCDGNAVQEFVKNCPSGWRVGY